MFLGLSIVLLPTLEVSVIEFVDYNQARWVRFIATVVRGSAELFIF